MDRQIVDAHFKSQYWKDICFSIKQRANNICEICRSEKIQNAHHTTYERFGNENLEDLLGVCLSCHFKEHHKNPKLKIRDAKVKSPRIKIPKLAKVKILVKNSNLKEQNKIRENKENLERKQKILIQSLCNAILNKMERDERMKVPIPFDDILEKDESAFSNFYSKLVINLSKTRT